jgi:beta-1,2-mannobiose phosphorylase / 1,2-beta-oligomannan phosphorylase
MVRVAEALTEPAFDGKIHSIRYSRTGYQLDGYPLDEVDSEDPRKFLIRSDLPAPVLALTSISWLLPVEMTPDGLEIIKIHYDKIISPKRESEEYGIEDARISLIDGKYYMTTCTVSSGRHATSLYAAKDGLNYSFQGIILDHQNKDMLLFEGRAGDSYYALTRPLGSLYFQTAGDSPFLPGPTINLASSPDLLHWKPTNEPLIRPLKGNLNINRIGGGTPPVLTGEGWLMLYHAVEAKGKIGIYRTYWALLDSANPAKIIHIEEKKPLLEANPSLTRELKNSIYLHDVVFTTGIADGGDHYIIASGELDLACRITHVPKDFFKFPKKSSGQR